MRKYVSTQKIIPVKTIHDTMVPFKRENERTNEQKKERKRKKEKSKQRDHAGQVLFFFNSHDHLSMLIHLQYQFK